MSINLKYFALMRDISYGNYLKLFSYWFSTKTSLRASISSRTSPVPRTTAVRGSSIIRTGISVSLATRRSSPRMRLPPPARIIPVCMTSERSSGGVSSTAVLMLFIIMRIDRPSACRTWSSFNMISLGSPVMRSLPRTGTLLFSSWG